MLWSAILSICGIWNWRSAIAAATRPSLSARRNSGFGRTSPRGRAYKKRRLPPPDKQRPVLVLTRDTALGHLATATVAPITSTIREVPSEVILDVDDGM